MSRRVVYRLLIALGIILLFASITYWLDIQTSEKPVGLGQNILGWATIITDILVWISAYFVNEKEKADATSVNTSNQIYINGNVTNSNLNIGDNNKLIISKDKNGNTDYGQSVSNAHIYLDAVKTEFDRENVNLAGKLLESVKSIISALKDEDLSLEYEILECRYTQKLEKIGEAKEKYENIAKRYPQDPRPLLYLAEICLSDDDLDGNKKYLERAEEIDSDFSLLKLQHILRKQHLGEKIDAELIDQKAFPDDSKIKANFYRLYGLLLENSDDQTNSDSFIAKAIHLNPDRFNAYLDELSLIERRMLASQDETQRLQLSQILLDGIAKVADWFAVYGDIGARNKVYLNTKKINALLVQENVQEIQNVSKDIFHFAITCYFDRRIENIIAGVFKLVALPDNELNQLLDYLKAIRRTVSDDLSEVLIYQFILRDALYSNGKAFFTETGNKKYLDFIQDLESENHERVLSFLVNRVSFALALANTLKKPLGLRRKIIENLPDNKTIQKDKLELLLKFDEKDFDEAFQILRQLDISSLDYFECIPMLHVARQKKAWDFEVVILEKLLAKERNEKELFNLKWQLSFAYLNLKKFSEAIDLGVQLLEDDSANRYLDLRSREGLFTNTLVACLERGKVNSDFYKKAKELLKKHPLENPSFEFKVGVETQIYLDNNEAENALKSVIEGVKTKKLLSPKEYAQLHLLFIGIANQIDLNLDSLESVKENCFVKLSDKSQWYFVGNDPELDTLLVVKTSDKYPLLFGKKVGDRVVFENKYSSEKYEGEIEKIFTIEKYIYWQVAQNFIELAKAGDLEWAQMIEIPPLGDSIDTQNLLKYFEDLNSRTEPLFDLYCKNNCPLAMLAINDGGLVNAIRHIQDENKGYVHFSLGTNDELESQRSVAKKILDEKKQFYIDGTSALVLSETGLLQKIYTYLPNMKVPQSVIMLFAEITNKFRYIPGQTGHAMGYSKGKINVSFIEQDRKDLIQANLRETIKLLEANPKNISVISLANKTDCFSETRVPEELCDACILAQKENIPILTEDHLYLNLNEFETKKKIPEYFSSWALIRVLYEEGQLTFDEYLDYFSYLSFYRFRFLPLNPEDIEKAVFGDRETKFIKPENIRKFNFPLVLSEEYGVPFDVAFRVVGNFLLNLIRVDSVALDVLGKIFTEILNDFPTSKSKKDLGQMLLDACRKAVEGKMLIPFYKLEDRLKYQKISNLLQIAESYNAGIKPLSPN